jgi:hypothetical protein
MGAVLGLLYAPHSRLRPPENPTHEIRQVIRHVKGLAVLAMLLGATAIAAAQYAAAPPAKLMAAGHQRPRRLPRAPSPIAIPQQFAPPQETFASFPQAPTAAAALAPSACQLRLAKLADFQPLPMLAGPGECGAVDAVLLRSVIMPDHATVDVTPPATLRCTMAEGVAVWLREDVAPAVVALGAPLRGLDDYDSYECRGRNRVRGAMLSEHGRANALDVRGFKLADGKGIELTDMHVAKAWREGIRASACARFATVLGPGSDGSHEEHIHLDLAERRGGYKLCQWDVREPAVETAKTPAPAEQAAAKIEDPVPLPRPRPAGLGLAAARNVRR